MMDRLPSYDSWQSALPRRVGALARMAPLHRFESGKAGRIVKLDAHDLRTLSLMVFDCVIERMGLAAGASAEEVTASLQPLIVAAEPDADAARITEIAGTVLNLLLNDAERRRAFCEEVRVVEGGRQHVRAVRFHYLHQVWGPNEEALLRATAEGVNLYTGTLSLDVEDAQAANIAVLRYQIGRGRFREAVATARQAVAISTEYELKVCRALDLARRDVTQVNWAQGVLGTLAAAREHLRTRIDADNEILQAVEDSDEHAEPHERRHVAELVTNIRACQSRNAELHRVVMDASPAWLDEHARQAFRPRAVSMLPDLEASVFQRALSLDDTVFSGETAWQVAETFLPFAVPPQLDTRRLVELLLAPPREHDDRAPVELPDAEELSQPPARFSDADLENAESFLDEADTGGERLSDLLERTRDAGGSALVQTLVYLLALRDYGESATDARRRVEPVGQEFSLDDHWGDDLRITPVPGPVEEQSV